MKPSIQALYDQLKARLDNLEARLQRTDVQLGHRLIFNKNSHGEVPASPGGTTKFLREDAKWVEVQSGGDVVAGTLNLPVLYVDQFASGAYLNSFDPDFTGSIALVLDAAAGATISSLKAKATGTLAYFINGGYTDIYIDQFSPTNFEDSIIVDPAGSSTTIQLRPGHSVGMVYDGTLLGWRPLSRETTFRELTVRSAGSVGAFTVDAGSVTNIEGDFRLGGYYTESSTDPTDFVQYFPRANVTVFTEGQAICGIYNGSPGLKLFRNGGSDDVILRWADNGFLSGSPGGGLIATPGNVDYSIKPTCGVLLMYGETSPDSTAGGIGQWHIVADVTMPVEQTTLGTSEDLWVFGPGSDGDYTLTGSMSLQQDMFYENLTVPGPHTLRTNHYRLFVRGTLYLDGQITNSGQSAVLNTRGGATTTGIYGAQGQGGNAAGGGSNAGAGVNVLNCVFPSDVTGLAGIGSNGGVAPYRGGDGGPGRGGGGGAAVTGSTFTSANGGNAGTISMIGVNAGGPQIMINSLNGRSTNSTVFQYGSGGGGGGATNGGWGGGGGNGGGCCAVFARTIIGSGSITAEGGRGGDGSQNFAGGLSGGGGGGGGGGLVVVVISSGSYPICSASGGLGGNPYTSGTGVAYRGGNGGDGYVYKFRV